MLGVGAAGAEGGLGVAVPPPFSCSIASLTIDSKSSYFLGLLPLRSSIPFLFSFHPKLKFYKKWKSLFIAIALTMLIFIPWDIIFTKNGIWGFNDFEIQALSGAFFHWGEGKARKASGMS